MTLRGFPGLAVVALFGMVTGCGADSDVQEKAPRTEVTVTTTDGQAHRFTVDVAATEAAQRQGLMYRTSIPADGGMLFAPYPPDGGPPRSASFWMRNTPSPLDILFIRPDGTVATIAENTVPYSEAPVASGEPVSAVLELMGGRSAELGIAAGDKVTWK